jgi:hypothetical protein
MQVFPFVRERLSLLNYNDSDPVTVGMSAGITVLRNLYRFVALLAGITMSD